MVISSFHRDYCVCREGIVIKTVILLEDSESISSIFKDINTIPGEKSYVALTPCASYAYERSDIPYKSTRYYGSKDDECHVLGLENIKRIERISTVLDKELASLHTIPTLKPAEYSIYNLKFLFDGLWTSIFVIKKIIETEKPDLIRLYTSHSIRSDVGRYAFTNDESVYAEILAMDGWPIPIEIIQNDRVKNKGTPLTAETTKIEAFLHTFLKKHALLFNLGLIWKREGAGAAIRSFFYSLMPQLHTPVLIYNSGYNWDDSLIEFYRQGLYPIYRITDESVDSACSPFPDYGNEVRRLCTQNPAMREYDCILGIAVAEFFYKRLSQIIGASIAESIASYQTARTMIQRKKIRCLLHSTRERAIGYAIIQASIDAKIPVVSWQHGGGGYAYWPMIPFIEFINSDWHFVFSEKVADIYLKTSDIVGLKKNPVFYPVGSSSLDYLSRKKKKSKEMSGKKPIVYITTAYHQNIFMISQPFDPIDLDDHLWTIQKRMMDLAKAFPDKEFIIKLHPTHIDKEPLKSYAHDHKIKNLQIICSEISVQKLTDIADMVIFDHITTGILQVLTSGVPVFAYTGLYSLNPDSDLKLKKRAYVYKNPDELIKNVEEYIRTGNVAGTTVDRTNNDFLAAHGTDIKTKNSGRRAVAKIKELVG
jgi:hypothetical protein